MAAVSQMEKFQAQEQISPYDYLKLFWNTWESYRKGRQPEKRKEPQLLLQ